MSGDNKEPAKVSPPDERYRDEVSRFSRQPSGFVGLENQFAAYIL